MLNHSNTKKERKGKERVCDFEPKMRADSGSANPER
jgi:hypothetical protein